MVRESSHNMANFTLDNVNELVLGIRSEVNDEVKEYLEKTYTGQYKKTKKIKRREEFAKVHDKTKNEACNNFDQLCNANGDMPDRLDQYTLKIDSWGWSSVLTSVLSGGKPLRVTMYALFTKYGFFRNNLASERFFFPFADRLENAYQTHKNPYHNSTHAADVLQTAHHMINATGLYHWLSDLEMMAMLFAASIHDAEHTGTTNDFHVLIRSPLAILYNDQSVLENHHLATGWEILKDENIFECLKNDEETYLRQLVTEMVLATDMSKHFPQLNDIKNTIETTAPDYWLDVIEDRADYPEQLEKPKIMALMIHAADISNAVKTWHIHNYTTAQLLQEFFEQGDRCKLRGVAPAPLCDRRLTDIPTSQINFSKYLVKPTFDLLSNTMRLLAEVFLPKTQVQLRQSVTTGGPMARDSDHKFGRSTLVLGVKTEYSLCFKRNSMRPATIDISAEDVIRGCDTFDDMWKSCMDENQSLWEDIIEDLTTTTAQRESSTADCQRSSRSVLDRIKRESEERTQPTSICEHTTLIEEHRDDKKDLAQELSSRMAVAAETSLTQKASPMSKTSLAEKASLTGNFSGKKTSKSGKARISTISERSSTQSITRESVRKSSAGRESTKSSRSRKSKMSNL